MPINTAISPTLHPDNIKAIEGYDEETAQYVAPVMTAFDEVYQSLEAVHNARMKANANPAWTEANKILQVAQLAEKYEERSRKRLESTYNNLSRAINATDQSLSAPLEQQAGAGTVNGEIRAHAKSLSSDQRVKLITEAIKKGDTKTAGAILGAPSYLSGLSDVEHEMYLRQFHEASQPETAKRLAVMKKAMEKMDTVAPLIKTGFEQALGANKAKIAKLRKANSEAEKAFILRDPLSD